MAQITTITRKELEDLKARKELLEKKKSMSLSNRYGDNAYRNDLSPSEYVQVLQEIKEIDKKIANAVVVPSINNNSKFTVEVDGKLINMLISVNYVHIDGFVCCTCDSAVGKALNDKKVGDIVTINTPNGQKEYKIISIR